MDAIATSATANQAWTEESGEMTPDARQMISAGQTMSAAIRMTRASADSITGT
jgi:hypothetical protein